MKVFADTSGLFASIVRNDRMHGDAKPLFSLLLETGAEIHTTSYVLLETLALLQARAGIGAAQAFEHAIRPLLRVTWVDESLHSRAFLRLERIGLRSVSLVDCAGFEVMEAVGIRAAFAYDPHFEEQGFLLLQTVEDVG
ncbi:MAG: PIN domain-containing protein [Thermodesulfobacteriota bacterium]